MSIDYSEKIPHTVDLGSNQTRQRALEQWQPGYVTDLCAAGEVDPLIVDSGVLGLGR